MSIARHARVGILPVVLLSFSIGLAQSPPDYDAVATYPPTTSQTAAAAPGMLRTGRPLRFYTRTGQPSFLWAAHDAGVLRGASRPPEQAAREHLKTFAGFYGLTPADIDASRVDRLHDTGRGGIIAVFRQEFDGVEVFRDRLSVLMDRRGNLLALSGAIPGMAQAGNEPRRFRLPAAAAITLAFQDLTGVSIAGQDMKYDGAAAGGYERYVYDGAPVGPEEYAPAQVTRARKVLFRLPGRLVPAWFVELSVSPKGAVSASHYSYVISAHDGRLLFRHNLTHQDAYTYRVWADPNGLHLPLDGPQGTDPSPHPTGTPDGYQAPFVVPVLITLQNGPISTDDPWLPAGATETVGNNADAYIDVASPDGYSQYDKRAAVTSPGVFDRIFDPLVPPNSNQTQIQAAITQAFYDVNLLHDWFYDHGFDEASGNAQTSNYGRGGIEGDSMRVETQDYAGRNNASMTIPPDGGRPIMELLIWDGVPEKGMTVSSPPGIVGEYPVGHATFGAQAFDITNEVVLVDDGSANPTLGCTSPFANQADVTGKIALMDDGSCTLTSKATRAQFNGAIGLIIANDIPGEGFFRLTGTGPASIPVVSISKEDGDILKSGLPGAIVRLLREAAVDRDSSLDNGTVAHEWGHYASERLVNDTNGLTNWVGYGLGEGYADFHELMMTVRPEDAMSPAGADFAGAYPSAAYLLMGGDNGPLANNAYYFGIRRYPYSTDMTKDPLTFKHIADGEPLPAGVPYGPYADPNGTFNSEPHDTGEIWATMLWECYASLLRDTLGPSPRLTFEQAQSRMADYLIAAYKMTPPNPTLLDARDALLAVAASQDPTDEVLCAAGFAKRGAGVGAIAPDRYSYDNVGVVESYLTGGNLAFEGARIQNDVPAAGCLSDDVLDLGETAELAVTLHNTGTIPLSQTTGTVTSTNPGVSFPAGNSLTFPVSDPFGVTTAIVPVSLDSASGVETVDLDVTYDDPDLLSAGPRVAAYSLLANADDRPAYATSDDVESEYPQWTVAGDTSLATFWQWERQVETGANHVWHGPDGDLPLDQFLISPVLQVAASGSFSFSFRHRFSFEYSSATYWDGGVIELSDDGGSTWTDIGAAASSPYTGTLTSGGANPLGGRMAYAADSPGYPAFGTVTVDLGTAYQGQSVQVRFRVGSDDAVGAAGWEIDDLAFDNITNLPFHALIPHDPACDADADGHDDADDCDPFDADLWAVPGEAEDLSAAGGGVASFTWAEPAVVGSTAGVTYDFLRSDTSSGFATATCLESADTDLVATDPAIPGAIYYYLVRTTNGCGGNMGPASSGAPRTGVSCP